MEKKIFFIDFDGTLMRDDKTISDKNREALRNAVDQGPKPPPITREPVTPYSLAQSFRKSSSSQLTSYIRLGDFVLFEHLHDVGMLPGSIQWRNHLLFFCRLYPEQQASANRVC